VQARAGTRCAGTPLPFGENATVPLRVRSTGIHHLDLVVSSIERSLPFYLELLGPLGWTELEEVEGERGETIWYVSGPGTTMGLREKQSDANPVPYDRYGVGVHHVCFEVDTREAVDERADWLRSQGATIESGPKDYWYSHGYYAVFFYDPDGIKLEIAYVPE
jgi:glyoxylase I family protein